MLTLVGDRDQSMTLPVERVNGVLIFNQTEIWLANCLVKGVCHMHKLLIFTISAAIA
jgi:hypothetical protein